MVPKNFDELDDELTTEEFGAIQENKVGDSRVRQWIMDERIEPRPRKKGKITLISKYAKVLPPGQKARK